MSAIADISPSRRRRPPRPAQCAGAGGRAGARRRQQHRDRRDRRHHRRDARARQGLATLPISVMVFGMWLGTLPLGYLARTLRPPLCACRSASVFGTLAGLDLLRRGACRARSGCSCVGTFCGGSMRPRISPTASPPPIPRATPSGRRRSPGCWPAACSPAFIGPQLVIFTKDLWLPYLFAATFSRSRRCAALAGLVLTQLKSPPPVPREERAEPRPAAVGDRARRRASSSRSPAASSATSMMNMVMTSAPLAMVGCGHSVTDADARHPVACARHVRAELLHRHADRALRRRPDHRARPWRCCSLSAAVGMAGITRRAFLDRPDAARRRLEFRLHRRDHHGDAVPPAGGAQQGPVVQRFPDFRHHGDGFVRLRQDAGDVRLGVRQRRRVSAGADRRRRCWSGWRCATARLPA